MNGSTVEVLKDFILSQFLVGENPDLLKSDTPLVTGGILDSLAMLKLVTFMEKRFGVEVAPHEADEDNFDTLERIASLISSRQGRRG